MSASSDRPELPLVFVGINGTVIALRKENGEIAWTRRLPSGEAHVPLIVDSLHVFAVSGGEVSCLDAPTGDVVWHTPLGFGTGHAVLGASASSRVASVTDAIVAAAQAASAAGI
jgi:outer membrane protein assembly factor BamB